MVPSTAVMRLHYEATIPAVHTSKLRQAVTFCFDLCGCAEYEALFTSLVVVGIHTPVNAIASSVVVHRNILPASYLQSIGFVDYLTESRQP